MPSSVNFWVGLDVHKGSITAAVFRNRDPEPIRIDRLPYDLHKIRRYFQRLQAGGAVRACCEASGAGYVLCYRARRRAWPTSGSSPPSTPPASDDASAPSPRPATPASATSASRLPGTTESAPPSARPCAAVSEARTPTVIQHAWKCQRRLYTLFQRLATKKPMPVAATAVAREWVGFLWAALRDVDVTKLQDVSRAA